MLFRSYLAYQATLRLRQRAGLFCTLQESSKRQKMWRNVKAGSEWRTLWRASSFWRQFEREREREKKKKITASVLEQGPNTRSFKRTLIYFNTDTQHANFRGNPLYQATIWESCFETIRRASRSFHAVFWRFIELCFGSENVFLFAVLVGKAN